jgi:hypothetical protein
VPVQVRHAVGVLVQDLAALAEAEDGLLAVTGHLRGVGRVQLHARAFRHGTLTEIIINSVISFFSKVLSSWPETSIGDPDPHVFGPPGSGSISQRPGSRSFPFLIKVFSGLK